MPNVPEEGHGQYIPIPLPRYHQCAKCTKISWYGALEPSQYSPCRHKSSVNHGFSSSCLWYEYCLCSHTGSYCDNYSIRWRHCWVVGSNEHRYVYRSSPRRVCAFRCCLCTIRHSWSRDYRCMAHLQHDELE